MANSARGEVSLRLGGETYVLRPTFGAVCEIEDALGSSLYEIGRRLESAEITARDLVAFAHACVSSAGYTVDRDYLGALIVESGVHATIATLLAYCRNYAFGGMPEKKAGTPPLSDLTARPASSSAPI
jgi:Phage tail tube protein, GTA-gp10